MPGLPRKSTALQFKKLMKKSGKARTNKKSGGIDPSTRKIATYEQYFLMKEKQQFSELDPYGEEEWGNPVLIPINTSDDIEIGDEIYTRDGEFFGYIMEILPKILLNTTTGSRFIIPINKFLEYDFLKKEKD